jgi:hypothetical protein
VHASYVRSAPKSSSDAGHFLLAVASSIWPCHVPVSGFRLPEKKKSWLRSRDFYLFGRQLFIENTVWCGKFAARNKNIAEINKLNACQAYTFFLFCCLILSDGKC